MIQFQENAQTERKDIRADRPYLIGPFRLPPGVQTIANENNITTIWIHLTYTEHKGEYSVNFTCKVYNNTT